MKTIVALTLSIFIGFVGWAVVRQFGTDAGSVSPTPSTGQIYTPAEVASHRTAVDCWLILNASVYDVTAYLPQHPGGPDSIIGACGTDATVGFQAVGAHQGPKIEDLLTEYRIGDLGISD